MPLPLLDAREADRLEHELDLRRRGYVPISSPDAIFPMYDRQLPTCRLRQVVPGQTHSRLVWSHAGRSGLDPRAVAPLAIVRVADGIGSESLDPPLRLARATRWLLDGDIISWLLRPQHRLLVGNGDVACLLQPDGGRTRCLTHGVPDQLLQDVATALGDRTMDACRRRGGGRAADRPWHGATGACRWSDLLRSALGGLTRLAEWYRCGVTGTPAWELARHGVRAEAFAAWERAGFTPADAAEWCSHGAPEVCARRRRCGLPAVERVVLVPLPAGVEARGLNGYDRWMFSRRKWRFAPCAICGASAPAGKRCRTCEREDRTTPLRHGDWTAYQQLEELGDVYAADAPGKPVRCGDQNCQRSLAMSAADGGVRQ